jgi:hypothetical protein
MAFDKERAAVSLARSYRLKRVLSAPIVRQIAHRRSSSR